MSVATGVGRGIKLYLTVGSLSSSRAIPELQAGWTGAERTSITDQEEETVGMGHGTGRGVRGEVGGKGEEGESKFTVYSVNDVGFVS